MDPVTFYDHGSGRERDAVKVARSDGYSAGLVQRAAQALADEVERLRAELNQRQQAPSAPEDIADMLAGSPAAYTLTRYVSPAGTVLGCTPDNWDKLRSLGLVETGRGGRRKVSDLGDSVTAILRARRHG